MAAAAAVEACTALDLDHTGTACAGQDFCGEEMNRSLLNVTLTGKFQQ